MFPFRYPETPISSNEIAILIVLTHGMTMDPPRIYVSSIGISIIIRYWMDDHKPYTARVFPKKQIVGSWFKDLSSIDIPTVDPLS